MKKIYLLPNLMTTACLLAGAFSLSLSLEHNYIMAAWMVLLGGVADSLDGRLARLTKSESAFGVQYDSLADLITFGVAPAVLVYSWALQRFGRIGMVISFLFLACAALRLARYNVQVSRAEKSAFQGLPVPAAAGLLATWVIFYHHIYGVLVPGRIHTQSVLLLATAGILALLMVSGLRYPSFKGVDFRSRRPFQYLVAGVAALVIIAIEPRIVLFCGFVVYAVYGIFGGIFNLQRRMLSSQPSGENSDAAGEDKKKSGAVHLLHMNRKTTRRDSERDPS